MGCETVASKITKHPFRRAIEAGDDSAFGPLLASDVVFHSPVLHAPFVGREVVAPLIAAVRSSFTDRVYTDEFAAEGKRVLVFRARIADLDTEGAQLLRFGDDELIADITVLLRPMRAAMALADALGPRVEKLTDATHRMKPLEETGTKPTSILIRQATPADDPALKRLAELDSQQPPTTETLLIFENGKLRAALPLDGGPALADPFHCTQELVALLRRETASRTNSRSGLLRRIGRRGLGQAAVVKWLSK
jgi:SnoaL-like domain